MTEIQTVYYMALELQELVYQLTREQEQIKKHMKELEDRIEELENDS